MGHDLHALHRQLIAECSGGKLTYSQLVVDWLDARTDNLLAESKKNTTSSKSLRSEHIKRSIASVVAAKRQIAENGGLLEVRAPAGKALTVVIDLEANQSPYDAEQGRLWGYFHPFVGMESIGAEEAISRGIRPRSEATDDYLAWKAEHFSAFRSEQEAERLRIENWRKSQESQPEATIVLDPLLKTEAERTLHAIGKLGTLYAWIGSVYVPARKTCLLHNGKDLVEVTLAESTHGYYWIVTEFDQSFPNGCVTKSVEFLSPKGFTDDLADGNGIVAFLSNKLHIDRPFWRKGSGCIKYSGFGGSEPPTVMRKLAEELDSWGFSIEIVKDKDLPQGCRIQFCDYGLNEMWLERDDEWTSIRFLDYDGLEDFEYWPVSSENIPPKSLARLAMRAGGDFSRLEESNTTFTAMLENAESILAFD